MSKCPNCGSLDTQPLVSVNQCTTCGKLFDFEGNVVAPGVDESTRQDMLRRMGARTTNVVGNLADLQRAGAAAVAGDPAPFKDAVEPPPGVTTEDVQAQAAAVEKVDAALAEAGASITASLADDSGADAKASKSSKSK